MNRYISGKPTFRLHQLLPKKNGESRAFPLNQNNSCFFFTGRYAFAGAIEALGLRRGDWILVPSYNCGVELGPLSYYDIEPVFYKINKDFLLDVDDLLGKITSRVKAVLVTHFLGFPQPVDQIKKICSERNLLLIEDCAHAFLSNYMERPLGSYGDAAFFSLLKTLPVPNGGVLILNRKDFSCTKRRQRPSRFSTLFSLAELIHAKTWDDDPDIKENILRVLHNGTYLTANYAKFLVAAFRKFFNPKALYLVRSDSYLFEEELVEWGISKSSMNILNNTDFDSIKSLRRRNFQYLFNHFLGSNHGILPLQQLSEGVCPLFFPVIVKDGEFRQKLYDLLKSRKVTTHPWWDRFHPQVPWEKFPDAVELKQRLFGL
ncbi:DegT/DnrJ/EryC1/StrS family aminotransferase, partial [bacterium]|nr:DegT/DnrJ/EryC1/StrS family aminotransferase [bacterium]